MDGLITINKVSLNLCISSRTLRHWEAAGLFKSTRDIQSGWRMYDEFALQCIRITNLLRHLDFSISEIKEILDGKNMDTVCRVLKKQLSKLDKTSVDLETRRSAISELIAIFENQQSMPISSLENILLPVAIERTKHVISKLQGGFSMENAKTKHEEITIIKIRLSRTVAYSCVGTEPEDKAANMVMEWIFKNNLIGTTRMFGFNTEPYHSTNNTAYGYCFCATIPEGIEIPEPLYEMRIPGGVYAVVSQYKDDPSDGWKIVNELCNDSEWEWEFDKERGPGLEEYIESGNKPGTVRTGTYFQVLIPVKKKIYN